MPTYHSSLDFTQELRKFFFESPPDAIAVEFPANLAESILEGVNHLPKISLVLYYDELLNEQLYIPIDPTDSMIEAIRLGQEYGLPIEFIDLFVKNYTPPIFPQPDSYVLNQLSVDELYGIMNAVLQFDKLKPLETPFDTSQPAELKTGTAAMEWLNDYHAVDDLRNRFMAARLTELMEEYPDGTILVVIGMSHWECIRDLLERHDFPTDLTAFQTSVQAELYHIAEVDLPKILHETPYILYQWESFRTHQNEALEHVTINEDVMISLFKFDLFRAIRHILQRAITIYRKKYQERVSFHKIKSLCQYLRNLPLADGMISPRLFEIVLAAKSIVNDDFAWIVWDVCKQYPFNRVESPFPTLPFTDSGIIIQGRHFTLRRHIPLKLQKIKLPLKPRPREKRPGEWREVWNHRNFNLVSHIPEDIYEENYFHHVRKRSLSILKDQYVKVHPFTSTMMDGIDFRETLRNWAFDHQIYVREESPLRGDVDAVVIIFDPDIENQNFPFKMMWYAEHEKESDLGFYSTSPGQLLVGPGISQIHLGGVISFFPPRGIPNIWTNKFLHEYPFGLQKADRLLLAGVIFAQKKFITYIAANPPSHDLSQLARHLGVKIIHLPLNRFNPVSLREFRKLHILAGKQTRKFASKYIHKRKL